MLPAVKLPALYKTPPVELTVAAAAVPELIKQPKIVALDNILNVKALAALETMLEGDADPLLVEAVQLGAWRAAATVAGGSYQPA